MKYSIAHSQGIRSDITVISIIGPVVGANSMQEIYRIVEQAITVQRKERFIFDILYAQGSLSHCYTAFFHIENMILENGGKPIRIAAKNNHEYIAECSGVLPHNIFCTRDGALHSF